MGAMDRARTRGFTAWLAGALVGAVALCVSWGAGSAFAATGAPTLLAPTASSLHNSPLSVEYELPEAGSSGTLSFIPASGPAVAVTLTSPALAAGKHHFFLNLFALASESANVSEASASSLADGEYTVSLSYSNLAKEPNALANAAKVTIKSVTAAPTLSEPTAGKTFRGAFKVGYVLPEAALSNSVRLTLVGAHTEPRVITLTNAAAGSHTAEVVPSDPALGAGVATGPSERLPADTYTILLSYQDVLGNPGASTSVGTTIAYPLCKAGSFGVGGEEPCTSAPKGSFVQSEGASKATECPAGLYAPETGLSECLPASLGHYVPAGGAKEELECEQGTYSDEMQRTSCKAATIGHYAPRGSVVATACPAGTHNPHTNTPSLEFCEADLPGSYSGEGAAMAVPCESGRYAPSSGSEHCLLADPGSYVEGTGASSEKACPAGTFAGTSGSVGCTETPAGTYATGGAVEPTPCPVGTSSGRGASACTGGVEAQSGGGGPGAGGGAAPTPQPGPAIAAGLSVKVAAGRHAASLGRKGKQRILLTCSASATVVVRVSAVVRVGRAHSSVAGRALKARCVGGKAGEVVARFKPGKGA